MKKILLFLVIAVALLAAAWFLLPRYAQFNVFNKEKAPEEVGKVMSPEEGIVNELDVVDVGNVDAEFREIDAELDNL